MNQKQMGGLPVAQSRNSKQQTPHFNHQTMPTQLKVGKSNLGISPGLPTMKQKFNAITPVTNISLPRKNKPNTSFNHKLGSKVIDSQSDTESKSSGGGRKLTKAE